MSPVEQHFPLGIFILIFAPWDAIQRVRDRCTLQSLNLLGVSPDRNLQTCL